MSKKWIITLSVLLACVSVVLILFWTLFALSSVTVQFHSTIKNLTLSENEIVKAGDFKYGSCVFFDGKKKYIRNLEKQDDEKFAYLKVLNIETVFPNRYVVHFRAEIGGQAYILDHEFRVLKKSNNAENVIDLVGLEVNDEEIKIGDFLDIKQRGMLNFYSAMLSQNFDLSQILGKFKSITLSTYTENVTLKEYTQMTLETAQNMKMIVKNIDFALKNKMNLLFFAENELFASNFDEEGYLLNSKGEKIFFVENEDKMLVVASETDDGAFALTSAELVNMTLVVDNLTLSDYSSVGEWDITYGLMKNY